LPLVVDSGGPVLRIQLPDPFHRSFQFSEGHARTCSPIGELQLTDV
jgi:hypothetical protein